MAASESKKNVRLPEELSEGEQKATASRKEEIKKKIKEEIKKVLTKDGILFDEAKIPNIAILGSGGGLRAMIALYGTLAQLKKCGLLDCVMYLCGVSGSTWCMSALYKNEDWAKNIEDFATLPRKIFTSNSWELTKAIDALRECVEDECYSLTDFWAYFVVYMMLKELHESTLSDQQKACENGKNPYPIYAAVDKHTYYEEHKACSWFEFTPHEVGVLSRHDHPGNGAYIATENFGSKFNKGKMVEKKKERNISFLQGLWGSALGSGKKIMEIVKALTDFLTVKTAILRQAAAEA
ncbi:cytosolic phospholipase A2 gamma-like [Anolis sagrei]|uniref:cytosolic phospholipase A2 gamma-like n=1 Tax=Anolis sagrei TaxID=38937 RepID=UPI00352022DB